LHRATIIIVGLFCSNNDASNNNTIHLSYA